MNKYLAERAIMANRHLEPFVLIERVAGDEIEDLAALDWQALTEPPTWDDVVAWTAVLALEEERAAKTAEILAALASSDLWVIRHAEDGYSLTPERRTHRDDLRALLAKVAKSKKPASLALPEQPPTPSKPG